MRPPGRCVRAWRPVWTSERAEGRPPGTAVEEQRTSTHHYRAPIATQNRETSTGKRGVSQDISLAIPISTALSGRVSFCDYGRARSRRCRTSLPSRSRTWPTMRPTRDDSHEVHAATVPVTGYRERELVELDIVNIEMAPFLLLRSARTISAPASPPESVGNRPDPELDSGAAAPR